MAISITAQDVRDAGDLRGTDENGNLDYPDSELQFEIRLATAIVNDELAPHSTDTERLELTAALLAAAYAADEQRISSLQQGSRSLSFESDAAMSLWRQAKQADPTGRLTTMDSPNVTFRAF